LTATLCTTVDAKKKYLTPYCPLLWWQSAKSWIQLLFLSLALNPENGVPDVDVIM